VERLTAADAWYLQVESATVPMHVAGVMVLDAAAATPRVTAARLRRHVLERFASIPTLRRRLVEVPLGIDHPCWIEDPAVDLGALISRHVLGRGGAPSDLPSFVGEFLSGTLDRSGPLWRMALLEGLGDGRIAVVVKMHHCLVDGMSGLTILGELIDLAPDGGDRPSRDEVAPVPDEVPGNWRILGDALWGRAVDPLRPLRAAGHLASSVTNLGVAAVGRRVRREPPTARPCLL